MRGRFQPGQSGNPAGKKKGTRNRATRAVEELLDGEGKALTRKAINLAKAGDVVALRLCLERIIPPRKDRLVAFSMPAINEPADAVKAMAAIASAVAAGELTPNEASELSAMLERYARILEAVDHEQRLKALESKNAGP